VTAVAEDFRSLLVMAGIGAPRRSTGRHPIELLTRTSSCTDIAVRTHVPVVIDLHLVLVPVAEADRVMRAIGRAVWPADPSPLEEEGHRAGSRDADALFGDIQAAVCVLSAAFVSDRDARVTALALLTGNEECLLPWRSASTRWSGKPRPYWSPSEPRCR
jgi:hypothetical protein